MSRNRKSQSGKPYDSSFALVKRITRRVSKYIPDSISSWFPSINEEETETVPPAKKQRTELNAPESWASEPVPSTSGQPDSCASASRPVNEAGPSGLSQAAQFPHRGLFPTSTPMQPARYLVPTSSGLGITADDGSNSSESTSGCSSLVPQENHMAEAPVETPVKNSQKGSQLYSLLFDPNSVNPSNEVSKITPQPPAKSKRPGFDPSVIRSPSICSSYRDVSKSPFYKGKTCYGGASAYRRSAGASPCFPNTSYELSNSTGSKRNSLSSNSRVPLNRHGSNHSLSWVENNGSPSPLLSAVTQRLLKAVESASPSNQSVANREAGNLKRKIENIYDYSSPPQQQTGPPIKSLNAPTVRDLMQNASKVQKVDAAKILTLPKSKPAWKDNHPLYTLRQEESASPKHVNKIRRNQSDIIDDLPEVVDLPQIPLQMKGLPTFDFAPKATTTKPAPSKPVTKVVEDDIIPFTFSAPIAAKPTHQPIQMAFKSPSQDSKHIFGSPAKIPELATASAGSSGQKELTTQKLVANAAPPVAAVPEKMSLPAGSGFGNMFKKAEGSWDCNSCCLNNRADAAKCVACETPRAKPTPPAPSVSTPAPATTSGGFGSLFKKAEGSWECPSCMLSNKSDAAKCVCCETLKPGSKPAASKPPSAASLTLNPPVITNPIIFSKPAGSWDCAECLISNKAESAKCVACETPKPGSTTAAPAVNSLGDKLKKPEKWACPVCLKTNEGDKQKCVACNCLNPGKPNAAVSKSAEKPKFSFGMPSQTDAPKKSEATSDSGFPKPMPEEEKSLFTFGAPKPSEGANEPKKGFVFGAVKKEDKEEKTSFSFGMLPAAKVAEEASKESKPAESSPAATAPAAASIQFIVPPASTAPKLKRKATDSDEPLPTSFIGSSPPKVNSSTKDDTSFAGVRFSPMASTKPKSPEPANSAEPPAKKAPTFNFLNEKQSDSTKTTLPSIFATKPSSTLDSSSNSLFSFASKGADQSSQKEEPKPSALFQFGSASKDIKSSTSSAFGAPVEKKPAFPSLTESAPAPSFSFTPKDSTPAFGSKPADPPAFGQKAPDASIFSSKSAEAVPSVFGLKPSEAPAFGSKPAASIAFGAKPSEPAAPSFGSDKLPSFKPLESTNSPFGAASTAAAPTFGSQNNLFSSSGTSSPAFGAANSSVFGQVAAPAASIFSVPGAAPTAQAPALPAFGAATPANASPFQASQPAANPSGGFSFGNNSGTPAAGSNFFAFGANKDKPAVGFGTNPLLAPKQAEIQQTPFSNQVTNSGFGSAASTPAFGAAPQPGGFNFGANPSPAFTPALQQTNAANMGGFNFNANQSVPQFNPEMRPTFNFTGNTGVPVFSATPAATSATNAALHARKIRKARRTHPR
ncbi:Hypothetical predicted protein [Cloeon dipterum]|uniref:Nuclear pore complex protein Nup153 n=1 Tax=Cloeon dipterum TaxID=197152 RepID=A0A8S1DEJ1_9INSE|nr:Hypothetical predicted protein [Cloeon dipterum]